jgi:hypothetical protein
MRAAADAGRSAHKVMIRKITTILLITICNAFVSFSEKRKIVPSCNIQNELVESTIAAKSKELKGKEYCQFRHYQTLYDIDKDGIDDFIVLFTIEGIGGGGNNHHDFMAVFLSSRDWRPIVVRTGGRGERDPIAADFRDGKIILETLVYLPSDGLCCPSGKGALSYKLHGDKLEQVSEKENNAEPKASPD